MLIDIIVVVTGVLGAACVIEATRTASAGENPGSMLLLALLLCIVMRSAQWLEQQL